jgi:hypothetical protein
MKLKGIFLFFLLSLSVSAYCEKNEGLNLLINYTKSASIASPGYTLSNLRPTLALDGVDMKLLLDTKIDHVSLMMGSNWLTGGNYNHQSTTFGGGFYIGPYLSGSNNFLRPWGYIGLGVFGFHDDVMEVNDFGWMRDYKENNFTSFGTKSGLGFSVVVKSFSVNFGYQFFATAVEKTVLLYHGIETGIGLKF